MKISSLSTPSAPDFQGLLRGHPDDELSEHFIRGSITSDGTRTTRFATSSLQADHQGLALSDRIPALPEPGVDQHCVRTASKTTQAKTKVATTNTVITNARSRCSLANNLPSLTVGYGISPARGDAKATDPLQRPTSQTRSRIAFRSTEYDSMRGAGTIYLSAANISDKKDNTLFKRDSKNNSYLCSLTTIYSIRFKHTLLPIPT